MPENLEARVAALEKEIEKLKAIIQAVNIDNVEGDMNISFSCPMSELNISANDVNGDFCVSTAATINGFNVGTNDVSGDVCVSSTATINGLNFGTNDVSGDVICTAKGIENAAISTGDVAGSVEEITEEP